MDGRAVGICRVISYLVTRQAQEIGIRMAQGATRERVQMGVIAKTLRVAAIGVALGTTASFVVAKGDQFHYESQLARTSGQCTH